MRCVYYHHHKEHWFRKVSPVYCVMQNLWWGKSLANWSFQSFDEENIGQFTMDNISYFSKLEFAWIKYWWMTFISPNLPCQIMYYHLLQIVHSGKLLRLQHLVKICGKTLWLWHWCNNWLYSYMIISLENCSIYYRISESYPPQMICIIQYMVYCYPQMANFYCSSIVSCLVNKLYTAETVHVYYRPI